VSGLGVESREFAGSSIVSTSSFESRNLLALIKRFYWLWHLPFDARISRIFDLGFSNNFQIDRFSLNFQIDVVIFRKLCRNIQIDVSFSDSDIELVRWRFGFKTVDGAKSLAGREQDCSIPSAV
jgi:hypothetical protein